MVISATPFNLQDYIATQVTKNQQSSLDSIALISKKLVERLQAETPKEAVNLTRPDYVAASNERARLMAYKSNVADELSAMTKAKSAVSWATAKLNDMMQAAQNILGSTDPAARAEAAQTFDDALQFLNDKVDAAGQKIGYQTVNLVGGKGADFHSDNLYIHSSATGTRTMVDGAYMGSHYNVKDASGLIWSFSQPDNAYVQYDANGDPTGNTVSADGLTVQSYDSTTGAVTFGGSGSLSGTLVRGGNGVLDSQFYNGFATEADVQKAIDDVVSAMNYTNSKGAFLTATATMMQDANTTILKKVSNLNKEIDSITSEELDASTAKTKAAKLKISLAVNNINLVAQHSTSLVQNLIDANSGGSPAYGVFGMMGY